MRVSRFETGGFVIHAITGSFTGRVSAWFDALGNPIDAEQLIGNRSRPVRVGGPIWNRLRTLGAVWAMPGRIVEAK